MHKPDLNLRPIVFALYDELNESRDARVLGMSQPAVSMALRKMRAVFNDPLFIRAPAGVTRPRAHALVRAMRPLVQRLQEGLRAQETFDPALSTRTFTMAMSDIGEMVFLPKLLERLRSRAPHCTIRSVSMLPEQLAHGLEQGEIDLAIGYFPDLGKHKFPERRLFTHHFACLLRAGHPRRAPRLSLKDFLAMEHAVVRAEGRTQEIFERFLERKKIRRTVVLLTPHFLGIPAVIEGRIATIRLHSALERSGRTCQALQHEFPESNERQPLRQRARLNGVRRRKHEHEQVSSPPSPSALSSRRAASPGPRRLPARSRGSSVTSRAAQSRAPP